MLHRACLGVKDVEHRQGFAVTAPLRTIADLAAAESVSHDIIEQALRQARQRGLIAEQEISELRRQAQLAKWFDQLLANSQR